MSWVTLLELKSDMGIDPGDTRDDEQLTTELDAAVAFVVRVRPEFDYDETDPDLPEPSEDLVLGTVRLAGRWFTRRRSPEGLVDMGEMGSARVPSIDPDIGRLLGIDRFRKPVVA